MEMEERKAGRGGGEDRGVKRGLKRLRGSIVQHEL